jgi:inner membrane transporter RhtA
VTGTASRSRKETPAIGLVAGGALSVQFGAALATKLFHRVGPAGAATLRLVLAAVILLAVAALGAARRPRPARRERSRTDVGVMVAFGLVMGAMNLCFYEAIDRIPLGVAVTIEFAGPLALSLAGSRRILDALWALAAGAGVALLATGGAHRLDPAGIGLALLAGLFWIGYILLSRLTGQRSGGLGGLTVAICCASLLSLPFGLHSAGGRLLNGGVLWLGGCVAVLSSVIPYSLELVALRRVTPRAFGVMLSLDPAVAAAAGAAVLGQTLSLREWVAMSLVMAANLGNSLGGRADTVPGAA